MLGAFVCVFLALAVVLIAVMPGVAAAGTIKKTAPIVPANPGKDLSGKTRPGGYKRVNPPVLSTIAPNNVIASTLSSNVTVVLCGSGFKYGDTMRLVKAGQADIQGTCSSITATQIQGWFHLQTPADGKWDVVVDDVDGSATLPTGFTITYPAPVVTAVSPASAINNGPVTVTITGSNFRPDMKASLAHNMHDMVFDNPILASRINLISPTTAVCVFDLTGVRGGLMDLIVVNPDGQAGGLGMSFTIKYPAPVITGISPASGTNNGPVTVTITGRTSGPE